MSAHERGHRRSAGHTVYKIGTDKTRGAGNPDAQRNAPDKLRSCFFAVISAVESFRALETFSPLRYRIRFPDTLIFHNSVNLIHVSPEEFPGKLIQRQNIFIGFHPPCHPGNAQALYCAILPILCAFQRDGRSDGMIFRIQGFITHR